MKIKLKGKWKGYTLIDEEDLEKFALFKWWTRTDDGYVITTKKGRVIGLHRHLMNAKKGEFVDHINHIPFDNRKSNLRICSKRENTKNQKKAKNNTSGYKGVSLSKPRLLWMAQIYSDGKHYHIGFFKKKLDAAKAYDAMAVKLHGKFAFLNFPIK